MGYIGSGSGARAMDTHALSGKTGARAHASVSVGQQRILQKGERPGACARAFDEMGESGAPRAAECDQLVLVTSAACGPF